MLRNAFALVRLVRERRCDVVHAHGRAAAWSAFACAKMTGLPFLTTWHKGFRQQNAFKRIYNSVMARGVRVIAVSEQIALLVNDRYGTSWDRLVVVPASVDTGRFDPPHVSRRAYRGDAAQWGVGRGDKLILVTGRMLRRKGHHVAVRAISRLKAMGVKDFVCVFTAEDQGTRYAAELWDQVMASEIADVVRISGPIDDLPAAYGAASVVVSAAVQPEGLQRALLEAQAMARPVIVSELGAGADVVLAPPAVPHDRMTRFALRDRRRRRLAAALIQLFSLPESARAGDRRAGPGLGAGAFQRRRGVRNDPQALCRRGGAANGRMSLNCTTGGVDLWPVCPDFKASQRQRRP